MLNKGFFIILSSPSGCGKTTVYKKLLEIMPELRYSVSTTTRAPRQGEIEGKDYFFVSKKEFIKMIKNGLFLEWQKVYGKYYGTRKDIVEKIFSENKLCIMDVDVKGGIRLKKLFPDSLTFFLLPPSFKILRKRLENRGTDSKKEIEKRFKSAVKELKYCVEYDYIIVNDDLDEVVNKIKKIIQSEV